MANVVKENDPKWAKFAGGCLVGEPFVNLYIPKDKINPANVRWVGLNGDEVYLAVGKTLTVPQPIADIWNYSYQKTIEAEESIQPNVEIQA